MVGRLADGGIEFSTDDVAPPRLAFFGVRPCDLRAIQIQDQVLGSGHGNSRYASRREGVLIVAVNCTEPGETCFCTSMGTGPAAGPGYDLALTELADRRAALVPRGHRHTGRRRGAGRRATRARPATAPSSAPGPPSPGRRSRWAAPCPSPACVS